MSPVIQGFGAFTGFQLIEETAWGTPFVGSWLDAPIIAETHRTEFQFAPSSPEFGDTGAETSVSHVSKSVVGELRFNGRLDARWFNILMAHIMGTEDKYIDFHVDGSTGGVGNYMTHWYLPSNQGRSLAFRVWKSGNDGSGKWAEFRGCEVTTARIEWQADGLLQFTVAFIGKEEVLANVSGSLAAPTGTVLTDPRWASNVAAGLFVGATPAALNFRGFVVNINRNVTAVPSFANDIDTANQPGPTGKRQVQLDITSFLEQDYANSNKPYLEYINKTDSTCRIKLHDTDATDDSGVYSMHIDMPAGTWVAGDTAIKEASSNPSAFSYRAKKAATAAPDTGQTDIRIGIEGKGDDPATPDDHWTEDTGLITQLTAGS